MLSNHNRFDICFVTYNSAKWIDMCISAVNKLDYDHKKLSLIFADNNSTDNTIELLEAKKQELDDVFADFIILPQKDNKGFGAGNNTAVKNGKSEYIFLLNVDTEIRADALSVVSDEIRRSGKEYGMFELRQMPSEHCKYYDPVTMDTSWSNGACTVIKRNVFEEVGGFDESIFMYSEDVDLSWNIRAHGYKIKYIPRAVVNHYTNTEDKTPKLSEQVGSFVGRLILSYKYGSDQQVKDQETTVKRTVAYKHNHIFTTLLNDRLKNVYTNKENYRRFYHDKIENNQYFDGDASIRELDEIRTGAYEKTEASTYTDGIDFTVVVRTYRRPELLSMTLESLTNQVYKGFRVIVVEDGENDYAEETASKYKDILNISYHCLGYHGGRCVAANKGVELATTKYVCFLDDDDYFFADHFETAAYMIKTDPGHELYALGCMEGKVSYRDESDPCSFYYQEKRSWNRKKLDWEYFFFDNPLPIQSFIFTKKLFQQVGGINIELEAFEDWDLWIRMLIEHDIVYLNKATSIFKTPFDQADLDKREEFMGPYRPIMKEKAQQYRSLAGIEYRELSEFNEEEPKNERVLEIIRPYREDESPIDVFTEIKHTKKWLISLPARLIVDLTDSIAGKDHKIGKTFGRVIYPWVKYSKAQREEIVNDILSSKCWRLVE